jgi:hypothetical protein
MTRPRPTFSVSVGQGRIGAGILAVAFASVTLFLAWPRPAQPYEPLAVALIAMNAALAILFARQAAKRVRVSD